MKNTIPDIIDNINEIENKIGYHFKNKKLLCLALTHRSFVNENQDIITEHNERLEFLGDTILGLIISDFLYQQLSDASEGRLSQLRSRIVDSHSCTNFMLQLALDDYLLLGRGEMMNSGKGRLSILSDFFEAIIAAIYLDSNIDEARRFIFDNFYDNIKQIIENPSRNWKADLQDYSQKEFQKTPDYILIDESGPDHNKEFTIEVYVNSEISGIGVGASKKEAQQAAAAQALSKIT